MQIILKTTFIKNESLAVLKRCIFVIMIEVNIVGTGNVAWHLAKAFSAQKNVSIKQVAGRSQKGLLTFKNITKCLVSIQNLKRATITIIAVSDDAIESIYKQLPFDNELVVHTSGFTTMLLQKQTNNRTGVFYPLQSFSKDDTTVNFKEIPLLLEASDKNDLKTLETLALSISNNVQIATSKQRRKLHLAAVFANNFTNHCYTIAQELCELSDVPFDTLHALITKTAQKAIKNGPKQSQTGPAKRSDHKVIKAQEELLLDPTHKSIYQTITKALQDTYGKKL